MTDVSSLPPFVVSSVFYNPLTHSLTHALTHTHTLTHPHTHTLAAHTHCTHRYPTNDVQRVDFTFPHKKLVLEMVDVGGQRNQRSRWKALSKECEAVIFVSSLDDYHQQLDEDATKNRLRESLRAFRVSRGLVAKYMPHAHTLLFLNKTDLFERSLRRAPFDHFFPEFTGKMSSSRAPVGVQVANISHMIAGLFRDIHHDMRAGPEQEFACQFTSAVDTNHMKNIFETVVSLILQANLKKQGFMS